LLIPLKLKKNQDCIHSTSKFNVNSKKKYSVTTDVCGFEGTPFSAYFGVILYEDNNQIARRIKWLNDFTGNTKI